MPSESARLQNLPRVIDKTESGLALHQSIAHIMAIILTYTLTEIEIARLQENVQKVSETLSAKKDKLDSLLLEVVLVPFSHTYFGGSKSFEVDVRPILDAMLDYLNKHHDMKFAYDDVRSFERWWSGLTDSSREVVKRLIETRQLELVSGSGASGGVNSHYFGAIMEAMEGDEFLVNHLNYRPSTYLSLNKLSLNPIKSLIAKKSSLTRSVIQHVNDHVKSHFAKSNRLEFYWKQLFTGDTDQNSVITHVLPYRDYDPAHSCGPDPQVCCQFDFRRANEQNCGDNSNSKIDESNIIQRARILADQYRKKSKLFKTNILLIPHGGDFRYGSDEFQRQHENYAKLFAQINNDKSLQMHVRIGTFRDYFGLMDAKGRNSLIPAIRGDFYTFASQKDHDYNGFYTGRPLIAHFDRILARYVRSADIGFSLANRKSKTSDDPWIGRMFYGQLVEARKILAQIQDYGISNIDSGSIQEFEAKVIKAIDETQKIIASAYSYLRLISNAETSKVISVEHYITGTNIPENVIVNVGDTIVVENSLGRPRNELICIYVSTILARVNDGKTLQQIEPVVIFSDDGTVSIDSSKYRLCFRAEKLPAFTLARFKLGPIRKNGNIATIQASKPIKMPSNFTGVIMKPFDGDVKLGNVKLSAEFDAKSGLLKSVKFANREQAELVDISFVEYDIAVLNFSNAKETVLVPSGQAKPISMDSGAYAVVKGPVRSYVIVKGLNELKLLHEVSLEADATNLRIRNVIGSGRTVKSEVAMRMRTNFTKTDRFFTEVNGYQVGFDPWHQLYNEILKFQFVYRKRFPNLPIHSNFYPMTSAAYLEGGFRLTLLGRQSLGAASLEPGLLDVILGRRTSDNAKSIQNRNSFPSESHFRLVIEHFISESPPKPLYDTIGLHSLQTSALATNFEYPPIVMAGIFTSFLQTPVIKIRGKKQLSDPDSGLAFPLPCDIHPVALRTMSRPTNYSNQSDPTTLPKNFIAFTLRRVRLDTRFESKKHHGCAFFVNNSLPLDFLFSESFEASHTSSLTGLYAELDTEIYSLTLLPNDLKTVLFRF
uniref:Glyco_hydro_38N domain-containing protein n=1 Tax=Panagrellus redivivus TaxID=6233 RepID=A0A7E4UVM6_PANRE